MKSVTIAMVMMAALARSQMIPPRIEWDVDVASPQPRAVGFYQGETIELQPRYLWGGRVVSIPSNASVRLWIRPMGTNAASYHIDGDLPAEGTNGRARVIIPGTVQIPVGNHQYWIEVRTNTTASLRAYGSLVVRPGVTGEGSPPPVWEGVTTGTVWQIVSAAGGITNVSLNDVLGDVSGRVARVSEADPVALPVASGARALAEALVLETVTNVYADGASGSVTGRVVYLTLPPTGITNVALDGVLGNVSGQVARISEGDPMAYPVATDALAQALVSVTNAYLSGSPGVLTGRVVYLTAPSELDPIAHPIATNALTIATNAQQHVATLEVRAITNVVIGLSTGTVNSGMAVVSGPCFGAITITNRILSGAGNVLMEFSISDTIFRDGNIILDGTGLRPLNAMNRTLGIPNNPWLALHTRGLRFHGGWALGEQQGSILATNITHVLSLGLAPTNWLVTASAVTNVLRDSAVLQNGALTGMVEIAQGGGFSVDGVPYVRVTNQFVEMAYVVATGVVVGLDGFFTHEKVQCSHVEAQSIDNVSEFWGGIRLGGGFVVNNIAVTMSRTTSATNVLATTAAVSNYLSGGTAIIVLPASSAGLPSGALWNDGGIIRIVP